MPTAMALYVFISNKFRTDHKITLSIAPVRILRTAGEATISKATTDFLLSQLSSR